MDQSFKSVAKERPGMQFGSNLDNTVPAICPTPCERRHASASTTDLRSKHTPPGSQKDVFYASERDRNSCPLDPMTTKIKIAFYLLVKLIAEGAELHTNSTEGQANWCS